ncbi:polynucleotide kinase-phosphatase [Rossellomorea marisflavi]|uniref:polynucleotide kinase-phosphatase n=1 Tax=Rossellomorea marisflavi TaxID=189381 RepID=UPI002B406880|nr:polynucleotide kinase-phosphatase [Rossellomorea marisflavi]
MMKIVIPHAGIVLLIGPSNSGKSTLLRELVEQDTLFPSEIVSSDEFRKLVGDVEFIDWKERPKEEADSLYDTYQQISKEAFGMMDAVIGARCRMNKLTFVDATHLHPDDRKRYIAMAKENHVPVLALILDTDQDQLLERDLHRDIPRGKRRIKQQYQVFKREKRFVKKEGYRAIYTVRPSDSVEWIRGANPLELDVGKGVDIIGDVHGCFDELIELLVKLGYEENEEGLYIHPDGRTFLSLGDIMSRGPKSFETMTFFHRHVERGLAQMIDSNHGWKIARYLGGRNVTLSHGDEWIAETLERYEAEHGEEEANELKETWRSFLLRAPSHLVLKQNAVPVAVCAHAGIKDEFIGKQSHAISDFCRYGDTEGFHEDGRPVRKDWTVHHHNSLLILWGHDPKPKPLMMNNTLNIDQGVVFGGELTAYRYPERTLLSVKGKTDYSGSDSNPLEELAKKRLHPPNIARFLNGYSVETETYGEVVIPKEQIIPTIDAVSHYTVPVEELIYIPPTMSPTPKASTIDGFLEHPQDAIDYYRSLGINRMVAEKKHMGSRGILLLFKDEEAGERVIGRRTLGVIYTRTGRRFFQEDVEGRVLQSLQESLEKDGYFARYGTDYVLLDAEIMPWNLKAKELIHRQYAHVSEQALMDRGRLTEKLAAAVGEHDGISAWLTEYEEKLHHAGVFKDVYETYCWDVESLEDIQIAPFHVLAHSGETFFDQPHTWHMEKNREFALLSPLFVETEFKVIDDEASEQDVIDWWLEMTADGHEGIVIKPETFLARSKGKLVQPAIKVRGQKYLHIIYGMDYTEPGNLDRLRKRNVSKKQKLALRQFALGLEGIRRFVDGESLERIHECALGTLASNADPVDPRL